MLTRVLAGVRRAARALAAVSLTALTVLTSTTTATAGDARPQTLKLAYAEFPPYTYTENGVGRGSLIELFDRVAAAAGLTYTAESAPTRRLFQGVADGDFHVFLGIKSVPAFEGTTLTSAGPITRIELNAYAMGAAPVIADRTSLSGKSVIVLTGYAYGGWRAWMDDPANKVAVIEARTTEQALTLLGAGRGHVLLHYALPMARALSGKPMPEMKASPVTFLDVYLVLSKKTPDAAGVLAKLEAGLAEAER